MGNNKKSGNSLVSFGKAGWGTIIFCMAMFWFFVGFCTDGNNITAPAVAEHLGIQSGTVLQMNSYGGILGVIFYIAFAVDQENRCQKSSRYHADHFRYCIHRNG